MKLLIAIGTAALLTAGCSASGSVSGSGTGSTRTTNSMHLTAGSNAGADAPGDLDVNRVNPPAGKAGARPVSPAQPQAAAPAAAAAPVGGGQDRCNGGIGNPPAAGNRGAPTTPGKRPQLPACMPE